MNETKNLQVASNEEALENILRHAEARPRPSDAASARAFNELREDWQAVVRTRRWRRRASVAAIAASLVVAVLFSAQWFYTVPPPADFVRLDVVRAIGSHVHHNSLQRNTNELVDGGLTLQHGDELATVGDTRIALSWDGGSLRLNEETRVRFDNARTLTLLGGAIYFDSTPYGNPVATAGLIEIDTLLGRVSHVGTQFQVGVSDAELQVSVREGQVHVAGDRVDVTLVKGEGMALSTDGRFERHALAAYDPSWQWATDIAPEMDFNGRTTAELLAWVARETGLKVRFASSAARDLSASEPRGIASLAPMAALRTIPFMTSLQYSLQDGYLVVDVATASER
ncbi:MAG: FecR domain-containing protein [Woeseia sp.]|nr:FecR domain-containing protein [Woeseia sp.]